ncbi:hypothetical protein [Polyangium jinanense]|uniref:Uncharacterized protein n=1 Tax=Polyangium jinanense TaxID=2829994 RepID=A0A9X4AP92_9BACT|nr:hypothetical protein [Polyangium jinanense]MDC3953083.1 hypothetical protein [Polyangium jinanense]MDC3979804.1 hypothetical protein [Polyangium jinanense]
MDVQDKIRFVQSTIEPMALHTYPHIAGFVAIEDDTGRHVGSALRCAVAGRNIIITAAHVVREARSGGRFAVTAVRGEAPFELHGDPARIDDEFDVAAYFLPAEYPTHGLAFWPKERIDPYEEKLSTDYLFVHGFPGVRSRFSPLLGSLAKQSLPYGVMLREDELPASMKPFQFAMDFDPTNMFLRDGNAADWLDPHGLSGSPVWRIGASGQRVDAWKPDLCLLVGIVTTWCPDEKLILATKVAPLLDLLRG